MNLRIKELLEEANRKANSLEGMTEELAKQPVSAERHHCIVERKAAEIARLRALLERAEAALNGWFDQPDTPEAYNTAFERALSARDDIRTELAKGE